MPLTRNLYREDEVLAALQYCILKGRIQEAVFWAHEATQSNMTFDLLQALFWLWMNFFGAANLSWYTWFHEATQNLEKIEEDNIIYLVISLARRAPQGDSTVFTLVVSGLSRPSTDRIGFVILPPSLRSLEGKNRAFAVAVKQGKLALAWNFAEWPTAWKILEELAKDSRSVELIRKLSQESENPFWKPEWIWFVRALAMTIAATISRFPEKEPIPVELVGCTANWKNVRMLDARVFAVPSECLYWFCFRGSLRVNKTTEAELTPGLELAIQGSQFWDEVPRGTDDEREAFYDTYFTSDIPDEWSIKNRQKSHGFGTIPVGPFNQQLALEKMLIRWFQRIPARGMWDGMDRAIKILVGLWGAVAPGAIDDMIHMEYITKTFEKMNLEPVRRVIEII